MNTFVKYLIVLAFALLSAAQSAAQGLPDFTSLVEKNAGAVVNISIVAHQQAALGFHRGMGDPHDPDASSATPFDELLKRFLEERGGELPPLESQSLGSGFIISSDGYVLTNYHVVEGADEVIVRLSDRHAYEAKIVGTDEASDIALLKIDARDLPVVKIGSSKKAAIGSWVLAIGSPFGFDATVTAGIISAKGRTLPDENYVPYIQTDVAINPGNSGGPLFNLDGEVIGINSQIYSRSGGFMGLSFAVPIELAMNVVEQIRSNGKVSRGYLGVLIQDVDRDLAKSFGMDHPQGALIAQVVDDSPAARAGLQVGDIILAFNGQHLRESSQLPPLVGTSAVNQDAELKVLRNGKTIQLNVQLAELPVQALASADEAEAHTPKASAKVNAWGLVVSRVDADIRQSLELPSEEGLLIEKVRKGPAQAAGIEAGDVLLMADGQKLSSVEQLSQLIEKTPKGKTVALLVFKSRGPVFVALHVPE